MTTTLTQVMLVDGEQVKIDLNVCETDQIFIRMGADLIAGIVKRDSNGSVYVWREVDGVYRYLGDILFRKEGDGSIIWEVCTVNDGGYSEIKAAAHLKPQAELILRDWQKPHAISIRSESRKTRV